MAQTVHGGEVGASKTPVDHCRGLITLAMCLARALGHCLINNGEPSRKRNDLTDVYFEKLIWQSE